MLGEECADCLVGFQLVRPVEPTMVSTGYGEQTVRRLGSVECFMEIDRMLVGHNGVGVTMYGQNRGKFCADVGKRGDPSSNLPSHCWA